MRTLPYPGPKAVLSWWVGHTSARPLRRLSHLEQRGQQNAKPHLEGAHLAHQKEGLFHLHGDTREVAAFLLLSGRASPSPELFGSFPEPKRSSANRRISTQEAESRSTFAQKGIPTSALGKPFSWVRDFRVVSDVAFVRRDRCSFEKV